MANAGAVTVGELSGSVTTVDATANVVIPNTAFTPNDNSSGVAIAIINAYINATNNAVSWIYRFPWKKTGGVLTTQAQGIAGGAPTLATPSAGDTAAFGAALPGVTGNGAATLQANVTGLAGTTINWTCVVTYYQNS